MRVSRRLQRRQLQRWPAAVRACEPDPPASALRTSSLPAADGPYLRRLRHLSLRGNALPALPPALAGAAQLETLDCGENEG